MILRILNYIAFYVRHAISIMSAAISNNTQGTDNRSWWNHHQYHHYLEWKTILRKCLMSVTLSIEQSLIRFLPRVGEILFYFQIINSIEQRFPICGTRKHFWWYVKRFENPICMIYFLNTKNKSGNPSRERKKFRINAPKNCDMVLQLT
jgi:hypothetical protein